MKPEQKKEAPKSYVSEPEKKEGVHDPETTPAEERGERIDTGKSIARGGREKGEVPGAEPDNGAE